VPMLLLDSCSLIELKSFIQRQVLGKRLPDHKVASSMLLILLLEAGEICCSDNAFDTCCAAYEDLRSTKFPT
jgi:hypothetical protein